MLDGSKCEINPSAVRLHETMAVRCVTPRGCEEVDG